MNITPLDILIIAVVVFGIYRLVTARKNQRNDDDEQYPRPVRRTKTKASDLRPPPIARQPGPRRVEPANGEPRPEGPETAQGPQTRKDATDAYRRAEAAWDHFRSRPAGQKPGGRGQASVAASVQTPKDFDAEEFLAGAKTIYARLAEAWGDRDLEDIRQFTTDNAYLGFKRRAESETRSPKQQVLLVNAQLVEMQERHDGGQKATVFYDATLGGPQGSRQAQEVWSFVRGGDAGDHWLLDATRPVDDTFKFQQ